MVEPVSYSAGKARLQRVGNDAGPIPDTSTGANATATTAGLASLGGASDMVSISAAAKGMPAELKAGPPIDIDAVERIRVAISENRYPVDLKAITEALFQNFLEITS